MNKLYQLYKKLVDLDDIYFQQDRASHYSINVRQYLDKIFSEGRRGHIEWPARSLDLNPFDYFFWGYLKSKIYITKPQELDNLQQRIVHDTTNLQECGFRFL